MPFGVYAEAADIDAARVTVLMPQALYPSQGRDFLLAINGVDLHGYKLLSESGGLEYNLFTGTIFHDDEEVLGKVLGLNVSNTNIPYVLGTRLFWEPPLPGLKVGGSVISGRLDADAAFNQNPVQIEVPAFFWVFSTEYTHLKWRFSLEYSRWQTKLRISSTSLLSENQNTSERGYFLTQYRFNPEFSQAFCYSLLYTDVDDRNGRENQQHDISTAFRWDINRNWLAKAEVHYMHGTAALYRHLNDDQPLGLLVKDWWAFLLKTTAYF